MLSRVLEVATKQVNEGLNGVALVPMDLSQNSRIGALRSIYPCADQGPHHDSSWQGVVSWIMTLDEQDGLNFYGKRKI